MVFLGGKNEVSADFSVNFQKSAYIAYDCNIEEIHIVLAIIWVAPYRIDISRYINHIGYIVVNTG
jgi:hypothetical protein